MRVEVSKAIVGRLLRNYYLHVWSTGCLLMFQYSNDSILLTFDFEGFDKAFWYTKRRVLPRSESSRQREDDFQTTLSMPTWGLGMGPKPLSIHVGIHACMHSCMPVCIHLYTYVWQPCQLSTKDLPFDSGIRTSHADARSCWFSPAFLPPHLDDRIL